jgi:2-polyprenyl-3-methyl-5-hydroxy-6-metoxy-1,4-benzoquinol methylase
MNNCKSILSCLACGGNSLKLALDLNDQPLANNFQTHAGVNDDDLWFPLAVNRCEDCNHLQLTHAVDPRVIYTNYLYVSGTSKTYVDYMDWYAKFVDEQHINFHDYGRISVLDIGCNDGSQLDAFKKLGFDTYGVDPAENLYEATSKKHTTWLGFWDASTADKIHQKFDVITSQNAFAHIPEPLEYLQLAREYLKPNGKIFISTSQADMVLNGEFDTIYHEHISFYNAESMRRLAERAGLHLVDVVKTPIHGTSYIFVLSKHKLNPHRMQNILSMETAAGLQNEKTYTDWAAGVNDLLVNLKDQIDTYRNYYTIVGYGAAAKGMTLINASDIHLDCVIDDNPLKQGLYCPGTTIPVVGIDWLDSVKDPKETIVFVPLAWNFYSEIKRKIKQRRDNQNDMFLRYFPRIITE